ncbi:TPA: hypothetical protein IAB29_05610 [Candidatus Ventrenecus stercoripullorum]|nr:hypothetical protein [Candidatus Ventrenecus stercoripullorum]
MSLLLAITSSIDSFFIGASLKASNILLTKKDFLEMFIASFLFIFLLELLCNILSFSIINPYMKAVLFFILGIYNLKEQEEQPLSKKITTKEKLLLIIGNSIDGFLVSLTLPSYPVLYLSILFSGITILLLLTGYKIPIPKKEKLSSLTSLTYFLIAILSLF